MMNRELWDLAAWSIGLGLHIVVPGLRYADGPSGGCARLERMGDTSRHSGQRIVRTTRRRSDGPVAWDKP